VNLKYPSVSCDILTIPTKPRQIKDFLGRSILEAAIKVKANVVTERRKVVVSVILFVFSLGIEMVYLRSLEIYFPTK
jgi:hypothetical protein